METVTKTSVQPVGKKKQCKPLPKKQEKPQNRKSSANGYIYLFHFSIFFSLLLTSAAPHMTINGSHQNATYKQNFQPDSNQEMPEIFLGEPALKPH